MFDAKFISTSSPKQRLIRLILIFIIFYLFVYSAFVIFLASLYDESTVDLTETNIKNNIQKSKKFKKSKKNSFSSIEIYNKRNYSDLNFDFENKCFFESHLCFSFSRCYSINEQSRLLRSAHNRPRIKVHVYPTESINHFSDEYVEFIKTILDSNHFEPDPRKACIFIPLIDFLNGNTMSKNSSKQLSYLRLLV
jgi:hypothetical protein